MRPNDLDDRLTVRATLRGRAQFSRPSCGCPTATPKRTWPAPRLTERLVPPWRQASMRVLRCAGGQRSFGRARLGIVGLAAAAANHLWGVGNRVIGERQAGVSGPACAAVAVALAPRSGHSALNCDSRPRVSGLRAQRALSCERALAAFVLQPHGGRYAEKHCDALRWHLEQARRIPAGPRLEMRHQRAAVLQLDRHLCG